MKRGTMIPALALIALLVIPTILVVGGAAAQGSEDSRASSRFPIFITIPERFIAEDSGEGQNLVNISYHFNDDGTKNIVYEISFESDPVHIRSEINNDWLDCEQLVVDWTGSVDLRIKGTDLGADGIKGTSDDTVVTSNLFQVTVTNTIDPPIITKVGGASAIGNDPIRIQLDEDFEYDLDVVVKDPDADPYEIKSDLTLANLQVLQQNQGGPSIRFQPSNLDVGIVSFNITVTDSSNLKGTVAVEITVINSNDKPTAVIDLPQENLEVIEGVPILFNASRSGDVDVIHGDTLNYQWTCDVLGLFSTEKSFETILVNGTHHVQLTVTDSFGSSSYAKVNLTVLPVPDLKITDWAPEPPSLIMLSDERMTFSIEAEIVDTYLEPMVEWYLDGTLIDEEGPTTESETDIDAEDLDPYFQHEVKAVVSYEGIYVEHWWTITIEAVVENKAPILEPVDPVSTTIFDDETLDLEIDATDPDGDELSFSWSVDGRVQKRQDDSKFRFKPTGVGSYEVEVEVSDGHNRTSHTWSVSVNEKIPVEPVKKKNNDDDKEEDSSLLSSETGTLLTILAVIIIIVAMIAAVVIGARGRERSKPSPPPQQPQEPAQFQQSYQPQQSNQYYQPGQPPQGGPGQPPQGGY